MNRADVRILESSAFMILVKVQILKLTKNYLFSLGGKRMHLCCAEFFKRVV